MSKKKVSKFPKWAKILLWILGVIVGLIVVLGIGLKIWVSTWKVYEKNGFLLKVPPGWDVISLKDSGNSSQRLLFTSGDIALGKSGIDGINKNWNGSYWITMYEYPKSEGTMQQAIDSLNRNTAPPGHNFRSFTGVNGIVKFDFGYSSPNEFTNGSSNGIFFQEGGTYLCEYVGENATASRFNLKYFLGNILLKIIVANSKCN